ncbi:phospholipase D family protein [Candidatus Schneideria nysicola]|uniref:phospholipase D family nuclease n=1 Tax=Candidatus Schneideria nysicola TaxID=1081631 RepID=UPI001FEF1FCC|nr:phospholipase D family protein [Candidatus Schneideria nysicola]
MLKNHNKDNINRKQRTKSNLILYLLLLFSINNINAANIIDIDVAFSPGDSAKELILNAIEKATTSIDVAAYSFTSKPISIALVDAYKRGIKVRIVADKKANSGKYTAVNFLANQNISVKLNDCYLIMHNKFMIIDDTSIQTGSFNYTRNAVYRNAENIIFIKNKPDIAKKYKKEFNRLWNEGILLEKQY